MARVCLVFPLALVLIVCVGSSIALQCYICNDHDIPASESCESTKDVGKVLDCLDSDDAYCNTQFRPDGTLAAKICISEASMKEATSQLPAKSGDCYSKTADDPNKYCYCKTDKCNAATKPGSSASITKPSVWTNLLWIGLVLASAFSSRMRTV